MTVIHDLFEPGFFASGPVHTALLVSAVAALVAGPLGVFTVLRGQSFAGEALGDIGTTGGSGAYLVGVGPLWGFLVINVAAVALMELIGVQRRRGRDLATGIVLGAGLGLAALFLYLDATHQSTTGAAVTVLFGSLFSVSSTTSPLAIAVAAVVVVAAGARRPAAAAGLGQPRARRGARDPGPAGRLRVSAGAVAGGGPVRVDDRLDPVDGAVGRPGGVEPADLPPAGAGDGGGRRAGDAAAWVGVLLAYDSYAWPPHHQGWPVSFFVVALVLVIYLGCGVARRQSGSPR